VTSLTHEAQDSQVFVRSQRLKPLYHLYIQTKNYINIPYQPVIINTQHSIHIPDIEINTNHGNQSKPALCYAEHRFKGPCINSISCDYHSRNSPRSSQGGSGTHKRSSPWMHQWHKDLHMQNLRWSCVENVSNPLLQLSSCFCWAHADSSTTVKWHAPGAKALDSQGRDAVHVPLAQ